ncbi:MAG: hypothetical protein RLZZ234_87 [Candidatus Parcubacteria bacterium]|jgi:hypothetical protein
MEGFNKPKVIRPEVGAAPMAPRKEKERVATNVETKASPETLKEIEEAEEELRAQLSLLESKRSQLEYLDLAALQSDSSPARGEKSQRSFIEIQEAYDQSVRKIQAFVALGAIGGLSTVLATTIGDLYYKSPAETIFGTDSALSDTAQNVVAGSTIGMYAVAALGGCAWLIKKWQKSRAENNIRT